MKKTELICVICLVGVLAGCYFLGSPKPRDHLGDPLSDSYRESPEVSAVFSVNISSPTWSWTVPDGATGFRFQMNSEEGDWETVDLETTAYTPEPALPDGTQTLNVQAEYETGSWSLSGSREVDINTDLAYNTTYWDGIGGLNGFNGPREVTVSPDGKNVYVTGVNDDAIVVFVRDTSTGALEFKEMQFDDFGGVDGLDGAYGVSVSPDGKNVYVTGIVDLSLAVFSRSTSEGKLTFVEAFFDGVGGVDGLGGARAASISPDGKHVYVPGNSDDAIAIFDRNTSTGELTFSDVFVDGTGSLGLNGVVRATVSPKGKNLYSTGYTDGTLPVFQRDTSSGELTYVEVMWDGIGGVDCLAGARGVIVSPDGTNVFVVSSNDNALAVFDRDLSTGTLNFDKAFFDGIGGVDGLDTARGVAVSPFGNSVYVLGGDDNALTLFDR